MGVVEGRRGARAWVRGRRHEGARLEHREGVRERGGAVTPEHVHLQRERHLTLVICRGGSITLSG